MKIKIRIIYTGEYDEEGKELFTIEKWKGRGGIQMPEKEFKRILALEKSYEKTQEQLRIMNEKVEKRIRSRKPRYNRKRKTITNWMGKDSERVIQKITDTLSARSPWMDILEGKKK